MIIAANKTNNPQKAKDAFIMFCSYYERDVLKMAITLCKKWESPDSVAQSITQCAFQKVWLYPTFNSKLCHCNDVEKALRMWMMHILINELSTFVKEHQCFRPGPEDLGIITTPMGLLNVKFKDEYLDQEQLEKMSLKLNDVIKGLSEQQRTIYLSYKGYEMDHKKIPRSVLIKLRKKYNLSQAGIRQCYYRVNKSIKEHNYDKG